MAKSLKGGLDGILGGTPEKRNKSIEQEVSHRATFVIDKNQHEKLKALAWWKRKQIKDVLHDALSQYFDSIPEKEMETTMKEYAELINKSEKK